MSEQGGERPTVSLGQQQEVGGSDRLVSVEGAAIILLLSIAVV